MMCARLEGWRLFTVRDRHTAVDYARVLKDLADIYFAHAKTIVLVQDNLSIHSKASLYEAFPAVEARRLVERGDRSQVGISHPSPCSILSLPSPCPDVPLIGRCAQRRSRVAAGHREATLRLTVASTAARSMIRRAFQQCRTTNPRGSSPSGARLAPQTCIRSIAVDRNHDAVMRIGGEAPGRRAHSTERRVNHVPLRVSPPPRRLIEPPASGARREGPSPPSFSPR